MLIGSTTDVSHEDIEVHILHQPFRGASLIRKGVRFRIHACRLDPIDCIWPDGHKWDHCSVGMDDKQSKIIYKPRAKDKSSALAAGRGV